MPDTAKPNTRPVLSRPPEDASDHELDAPVESFLDAIPGPEGIDPEDGRSHVATSGRPRYGSNGS
jgi:hypothetical protein